jgi:hypothetical protein
LGDNTVHDLVGEERDLSNRRPHVYDAEDYGLDIDELWPELQYHRDFYGIEDEA